MCVCVCVSVELDNLKQQIQELKQRNVGATGGVYAGEQRGGSTSAAPSSRGKGGGAHASLVFESIPEGGGGDGEDSLNTSLNDSQPSKLNTPLNTAPAAALSEVHALAQPQPAPQVYTHAPCTRTRLFYASDMHASSTRVTPQTPPEAGGQEDAVKGAKVRGEGGGGAGRGGGGGGGGGGEGGRFGGDVPEKRKPTTEKEKQMLSQLVEEHLRLRDERCVTLLVHAVCVKLLVHAVCVKLLVHAALSY